MHDSVNGSVEFNEGAQQKCIGHATTLPEITDRFATPP
jgi:hypothetical protein